MFRNYLKTAIRNLRRNKSYAVINITGLTVGIASCLLIFLVIQFETSFDDFHADKGRIYRVSIKFHNADGVTPSRSMSFPAGKQLRFDMPQLEKVASIFSVQGDQMMVLDDNSRPTQKKFNEDGLFFAEPDFFGMFNFPFQAGDSKTALNAPGTVVLTEKAATKYFGDWKNAMGKTMRYKDHKILKVTGILKDIPDNTDFPIAVVMSMKTSDKDTSTDWASSMGDLNTFVVLPPNMTEAQLDNGLVEFGKKHITNGYDKTNTFISQPLSDMHFNKQLGTYRGRTFSRELITALSLIALFLLIIACINFINLATAQAVNRAKEVGVRKVLGSRKQQLILQFLSETFIITISAVAIAFVVAYSVLPYLNILLETQIALQLNVPLVLMLLGTIVVVTLLSGLYPALILSGFNPITALKSKFTNRTVGGISLRRILVVLQFAVAQALIIGVLVVVGQMNYFKDAPMGFDKDAVLSVDIPNDSISLTKLHSFKIQLLQQANIKDASYSTFSIIDDSNWNSDFNFDNSDKSTPFNASLKWADADVFKTFNLQMAAGRAYQPSDTVGEFVINELLAKKLGFVNPQDILNKKISFWGGVVKGHIVGVVKDFNGTTMAKAIQPVVMSPWKSVYQTVAIKIQPQNIKATQATIEKLWNATFPESVYHAQFLDDKIANFYKQEGQLSQLYKIFAGIAIFISCLGLYGLVSFMAAQRTKEVGIRKVLGASAGSIVYLFSKEFTILIAVSFFIAAPVAYYFMHEWLNNFVFRIGIGVDVFVLTIGASIVIAWITVGYRAFKAASANPTVALKSE